MARTSAARQEGATALAPRGAMKKLWRPGLEESAAVDVVIEALYPGALVGKAGKRIVWIPRGNERVPLSMAEDLFGCFDRLVVHPHGMLAIQATIYRPETAKKGGTVTVRKTKVRRTFVEPLVAQLGELPAIDRAHAVALGPAVRPAREQRAHQRDALRQRQPAAGLDLVDVAAEEGQVHDQEQSAHDRDAPPWPLPQVAEHEVVVAEQEGVRVDLERHQRVEPDQTSDPFRRIVDSMAKSSAQDLATVSRSEPEVSFEMDL